jgi:hypothetical protein
MIKLFHETMDVFIELESLKREDLLYKVFSFFADYIIAYPAIPVILFISF